MDHSESYPRFYGKYRGKVTEIADPLQLGRIMVEVPSVLGETPVWAMPCVPYAGPQVGMVTIPPMEANVWVEFEEGRVDYPIWVGCFWGEGQFPERAMSPEIKLFQAMGVSWELDETPGEGGVTIRAMDPVIEEPMTIQINAEGIILTNMPSSVKITAEGIISSCGEGNVTINEGMVKASAEPGQLMISAADNTLSCAESSVSVTEEAINVSCGAGMITVSPETIVVNEGALLIE